jgi:hypothetical protein
MADSTVAPVTPQNAWELIELGLAGPLFNATGDPSASGAYAHRKATTFWPEVQTGAQRAVLSGAGLEGNSLGLSFFGKPPGSGSAPFHAVAALWMGRKLQKATDVEYRGTFLGELELILGEQQRDSTGGILPDDVLWVKSINPVKDRALFPGIRIVGQDGDAAAEMYLDGVGAWGYILELRCKVPAGASGSAMASVGAMRVIL